LKVSIKDNDNTSHKPAPINQTPPEKEEEIKLSPPDDEKDEFSDSVLGLDEINDKNAKPLKIPSAADLEKDLAKSTEKKKKKK